MVKRLYTFPKLSVYGASLRGPVFNNSAIMFSEFSYYYSKENEYGRKAGIKPNQIRWVVGYKQEIQKNLTMILQYYLKSIQQYTNYHTNLTNKKIAKDHHRHIVTINLIKKIPNNNLYLSLYNYYSTNYKDGYLRLNATYKITNLFDSAIGGNFFYGNKDHTFFSQFRKNNNVYASLRYGFSND
jgi:hypothetical protein